VLFFFLNFNTIIRDHEINAVDGIYARRALASCYNPTMIIIIIIIIITIPYNYERDLRFKNGSGPKRSTSINKLNNVRYTRSRLITRNKGFKGYGFRLVHDTIERQHNNIITFRRRRYEG